MINNILIFIWLSSFLCFILFNILNLKNITHISIFNIIFAFCTAALRPDYFPDYLEYVAIYKIASTGDFSNPEYWMTHSEPGFKILCYMLSLISDDPIFLFAFMSFLSFTLILLISRMLSINLTNVWFIYYSLFFITRDMGQIRLSIASSLIVYTAISRFNTKSLFATLTSTFVFQYFSFISVAITHLLRNIRPTIYLLSTFSLISVITSYVIDFNFLSTIGPEKIINNYDGSDYISGSFSSASAAILRNVIIFLLFWHSVQWKNLNQFEIISIWLLFLSFAFYLLFHNVPVVAQRFSAYFGAIAPYALGYALTRPQNKIKFTIAISILCFINFFSLVVNAEYMNTIQ